MRQADIHYIAFEGGGGKGIVYLGALRALEVANKLPMTHAKRTDCPGDVLIGVAGASAGATTAYFMALGMGADDIESKTGQFASFFDAAQPAMYKGVAYQPGQGNIPVFVVDDPKVERTARQDDTSPTGAFSVATGISSLFTGNLYANRTQAEDLSGKLYRLYQFVYPLGFVKLVLRALSARKKLKKAGHQNQLAAKLVANPRDLNKYVYSLLFDRGLFSGIAIREFLQQVAVEQLAKNFGVTISATDAARLTFKQFHDYTGNELRIAGANITKGVPVYFSHFLTPDYPVADAVGMSMAIPFAFKPTLSQAWAHMGRDKNSAHNERYRGFFCDAGTLNNLPIHAFDFGADEDNFLKKVVTLDGGMFGIRCTGGIPTNPDEDADFPFDPSYLRYLDDRNRGRSKSEKIEAKNVKTALADTNYQIDMKFDALSPLAHFIGRLYNAVMYYTEDGQVRSQDEFKQTMELFSYDVGLFDFTVQADLSNFVQARAAIKVGAMIAADQSELSAMVIEKYYAGRKDDAEKVRQYIAATYDYYRKFKAAHEIP